VVSVQVPREYPGRGDDGQATTPRERLQGRQDEGEAEREGLGDWVQVKVNQVGGELICL